MKFNRKLDYYEFSWDGGSTITKINTRKGEKSVYPPYTARIKAYSPRL